MPTLDWIGKQAVVNHHHQVPFRLLQCDPALSAGDPDAGNLLVQGDNLEALKALLPYYAGQVKCIYIDPPYNTGNEGWAYNDNVNSPEIRRWLGDVVGKEGEDLSRHDKWLCMMYPRLALLREFLREDGAIFVSIDDREAHNLRHLLDEAFGAKNFIATIVWQKMDSPKNTAIHLSEDHDYIVIYAKDAGVWRPNPLPRTESMTARYKNPDDDPRGPWLLSDLAARNFYDQGRYEIVTPTGKVIKGPPSGSYWRVSWERFQELERDGRIWWGKSGKNRPGIKRFLSEVREGVVPQTLWLWKDAGSTRHAKQELSRVMDGGASSDLFITPKPTRLIERILHIATDNGSLILDSFAGSATTAHAVLAKNQADGGKRRCILIEMDEIVCQSVAALRLRRVVEGYERKNGEKSQKVEPLGGGFRFCKLGNPLFDADGAIAESVTFADLARHVFFTETGVPIPKQPRKDNPLLGVHAGRAVYREVLDRAFDGRVTVTNLAGALYIRKPTLVETCTIIVTTFQALRVDDPEGRKVYRGNGELKHHFDGLTAEQREFLQADNEPDPLTPSLKNVLRVHRPLVVVDEAHNARTELMFETLRRFNPSCVIELTATPVPESNVLHSVSAAELKAAEMIKLPIMLRARDKARDAVVQAIAKRKELAEIAAAEERGGAEYVRPIVLYQAESRGGEMTPENLKALLVDELGIDPARVAICTGTTDELPTLPIQSRDNPIEHVITIQKLREGWDCPFAYILCSVANLSAKTAVEQLLGRVLRMPYARRRGHDDLNRAYCYATSADFQAAAQSLEEAIVDSGFTRLEARRAIEVEDDGEIGLFAQRDEPIVQGVSRPIDLRAVPEAARVFLEVNQAGDEVQLRWTGGVMSDDVAAALASQFDDENDRQAVEVIRRRSRNQDASPAAMGQRIRVPGLSVREDDGQMVLLDDQPLEAEWDLCDFAHELSESEFRIVPPDQRLAEIDVNERGRVETRFLQDMDRQLLMFDRDGPRNAAELARWLDRQIVDPFILPAQKRVFLMRMVEHLLNDRGFAIEQLARHRHYLKDAAANKINAHKLNAETRAYQHLIETAVGVDLEQTIDFGPVYPANQLYTGGHRFERHFYHDVAKMNREEVEVAKYIDSRPDVEYWVRNLEHPPHAFYLRLPTGRFFPDFVVQIIGERFLVVEHKGMMEGRKEEEDKRLVGELWAAQAPDQLAFCWTTKNDYRDRIDAAIAGFRRRA